MLENAKWISYPVETIFEPTMFVKKFNLDYKNVTKATLTITSHGCYYATLNDERVGNFIFAPGITSNKRLQVQKYNILKYLKEQNELKVTISKGWFKGRINHRNNKDLKDIQESLICEISLSFKDGNNMIISSDSTWEAHKSKIRFADFYDGEHYDSTFNDSNFLYAVEHDYPKNIFVKQQGETIVEHETIKPKKILKTPKGELVVDFGQNLTGYFIVECNAKKGDLISFNFGEVLDKDGNFYNENYRSAKAEFEYICSDGHNLYKPKLAFYGFRYIKVNSFPEEITNESIKAIVIYSNINRTGYLDSSNKLLNKLFSNIIWGQKSNFLDIPTDCPQRDERWGWTGDAQVFARAASYNFNVDKFFNKWLKDMSLEQGKDGYIPLVIPQFIDDYISCAGWNDAITIIPWRLYLTYGDKIILKNTFKSMKLYLEYIKHHSKNRYLWTGCEQYGDWLGLDAKPGSYEGSSRKDFIASAYYAYSTSIVIKTGRVLKKNTSKYETLYKKIVDAINKKFKTYKTQTECAIALYFNITNDKESTINKLVELIKKNNTHLATGFLGTPYILHALSSNGYSELAYDLLLQKDYPSWLYPVTKGATTMWEHWDGINENGDFWSKDMNSFNHYAYGAVADWVYEVACGIKSVEEYPGFEKIIIQPTPTNKLDYLSAKIKTKYGVVSSKWYHLNGAIKYEIETPTSAKIIIDGIVHEVNKGKYSF